MEEFAYLKDAKHKKFHKKSHTRYGCGSCPINFQFYFSGTSTALK